MHTFEVQNHKELAAAFAALDGVFEEAEIILTTSAGNKCRYYFPDITHKNEAKKRGRTLRLKEYANNARRLAKQIPA